MPRIVGQSPYGVAVEQDDGTVLTMPPGYAPPELAPAIDPDATRVAQSVSPVPDIAHTQIGRPPPTSTIANPDPRQAPDANLIEMEPEGEPGTGPQLPALPGDSLPSAGIVSPFGEAPPDAVSGVGAPMASAAPAPEESATAAPVAPINLDTPEQGGSPATEPILTPEEQAVQATLRAGVAAANRADEEAALLAERDAKMADADRLAAEARARIEEQRQIARAQADDAEARFVDFDLTPEERTSPLGIIGLIFGGIGNVMMRNYGGQNPVIAILEKKAADAARARSAQQSKLGQVVDMKRGKVDALSAISADADAYHLSVLAGIKESYARQIETAGANYGSAAALEQAQLAAAQIRASAEKDRAARDAAAQKAAIDAADFRLKQVKTAADIEHDRVTGKASLINAYTGAAAQKAQTGQWSQKFAADEAERAARLALDQAELARKIKEAEAKGNQPEAAVLRHQREVAENTDGRRVQPTLKAKVIEHPDGTKTATVTPEPLMNAPAPMVDDYGKPVIDPVTGKQAVGPQEFLAPTVREGEELRKKYAITKTYTDIVDKINAAIAKNGWSSDTLRSDEWLEAQSLWADGALLRKGPEMDQLGVLSGADIDIIAKAMGTKDPTQVLNPTAGLRTSRKTAVAKYNDALIGARYTGDPVDFADAQSQPGGVNDATNQAVRAATSTDRSPGSVDVGLGTRVGSKDGLPISSMTNDAGSDVLTARETDAIESLVAQARSPDPAVASRGKVALARLAKRSDIRGGVVSFMADAGIDMTGVDDDLAETVRASSRWNEITGDAARTVDANIGIGGVVKRAAKRGR